MVGGEHAISLRFANQAGAQEIDKVLRHYGSPMAGQGAMIVNVARSGNANPVVLLGIAQEASQLGRGPKPENMANPWSIHFNEGAKGIVKLRRRDGSMPSVEESARGAAALLAKAKNLSDAARFFSERTNWAGVVAQHSKVIAGRMGRP